MHEQSSENNPAIKKPPEPQYSKPAAKAIEAMDKATKSRIKKAIEGLTETPPRGDIIPLQGYNPKTLRLRKGKYRILFRFDTTPDGRKALFISDIDSRGDIYK